MRIGLLTTSFPGVAGDPAGGFVAEHAAWLASQGHRVDVIAGARPGAAARQPWAPGIDVCRLAAGASLFAGEGAPERLARLASAWPAAGRFALAQVRAALRARGRWDAVVAHWLVPSALAAVATHRPAVAIAHSGDVHLIVRAGLARRVARGLARAGVHVWFVSAALRDRFAVAARGLGDLSHGVCSMGVEVARLAAAGLERSRLLDRPPRVLFLGRLVPIKGVDVLIDAAALLSIPVEVRIAGAGPCLEALQARARRRGVTAHWLGELRGPARDRELGRADVVVLPSVVAPDGRTEGAPLVALEALAAGAPLVASRTGGLAELPRDAVAWAEPGDHRALARELQAVLADADRRSRMVGVARDHVRGCDWSVVGDRLIAPLVAKTPCR